ncbi:Crocetin glucosyltransferase 3 [Apostasia shenzhenica]|uniref:Glycosyltransferase n=1 Tax=Apostasia shenzhenica TaxID=1088818 RepID=A0A2I0A897_9ASPA|nr:Crocetin glucosyltransferase 3 [Apostasia shenzhenica]
MAQGHIIPFLALARLIERRNPLCSITIANTPLNVLSLRAALPPDSSIHLAELPFSSADHGLPAATENSDSLPSIDLFPRLLFASESLEPHFDRLLADLTARHGYPPLCIIADVFTAWTLPTARKHRIPHFSFTTCGGFGSAVFMSLWLHLPHRNIAGEEFPVPGFPPDFRLHRTQMSHYMRAAAGSDDWSVYLRRQIGLCFKSDAMITNSVEEIEPKGVQLLRQISGLAVYTVGPLVPLEYSVHSYRRSGKEIGIEVEACADWLESHRPESVLYISFGSQNTIGAAQMMALAEGLEASGVPFIWVVRPPLGFDMNGNFRGEEWLPAGFEARMEASRRGLVVRHWAPQLEILSHRSIGGFLSHCGWNSVLESLSRGVPVIGWPVASDQFYNSMMMEGEMGVAVELARGVTGDLDGGKVERVVRTVMKGEKGREMRERAARCREMIKAAMEEEAGEEHEKGSSLRAIDELLQTAMAASSK